MAEPVHSNSVVAARPRRWPSALGLLLVLLELALALRVLAAEAVEWYVRRGGVDRLCLFPDTNIYWELARAIRAGAPYQIVEWSDIPHFALRTPGYPIALAGCQALFGERTLAARLVQGVLGTCSVYLVYQLCRQLVPSCEPAQAAEPDTRLAAAGGASAVTIERRAAPIGQVSAPLVAAALAALDPYYIFMSVILLSEAVFEPLMLAALWGLAVLWPRRSSGRGGRPSFQEGGAGCPVTGRKAVLVSLVSGAAAGLAVLVRPSWVLFVPAALAAWVLAEVRACRGRQAARGILLWLCGMVLVMSPWWARNARIYGRFVPTALWLGASLYDGLNPAATGASDMSFRSAEDIWPLDEQDQDAELLRRALRFAGEHPGRVIALAIIKLGRFWSPWPNADVLGSPALMAAGAFVALPLFGLLALGAWSRRHDLRVWVLSAGPLLYFCALHLVFASSMRYRIPGEMPALALAAFGWLTLLTWWRKTGPTRRAAGWFRQV
jgi:4-amino-4-deoxy-L-arabinose transferase-like glycosyltransferase